jgi:hypothetical protein
MKNCYDIKGILTDKSSDESPTPAYLKLESNPDHTVALVLADADGNRLLQGRLLTIDIDERTIYRAAGVNSAFGFSLNKTGCITIN